jgi:hypothetical protein
MQLATGRAGLGWLHMCVLSGFLGGHKATASGIFWTHQSWACLPALVSTHKHQTAYTTGSMKVLHQVVLAVGCGRFAVGNKCMLQHCMCYTFEGAQSLSVCGRRGDLPQNLHAG